LTSNKQLTQSRVLKNGLNTGYSFGFFIKTLQVPATIQHGGNLYGFTSSDLYLPKEDIHVTLLSNRSFKSTEEIANYIGSEMLGKPINMSRNITIDYQTIIKIHGTYELASDKKRIMKILTVSDRLILSFPEQKGAEVGVFTNWKGKI
jgi:hypothetical protein